MALINTAREYMRMRTSACAGGSGVGQAVVRAGDHPGKSLPSPRAPSPPRHPLSCLLPGLLRRLVTHLALEGEFRPGPRPCCQCASARSVLRPPCERSRGRQRPQSLSRALFTQAPSPPPRLRSDSLAPEALPSTCRAARRQPSPPGACEASFFVTVVWTP